VDPFVVFDCEKVLRNRFALTVVAAARSRALKTGSAPRLKRPTTDILDLALQEIAAGVFTRDELDPCQLDRDAARSLPSPARHQLPGHAAGATAAVSGSQNFH
jgi:DNA-directed RNA polymerase subunit omega